MGSQVSTRYAANRQLQWLLPFVAVWGLITHQGLLTAGSIWLNNEIFNHCLLVLPAVGYLLWQQYPQGDFSRWAPSLWGGLCFSLLLLLYLVAWTLDIRVVMHLATFMSLAALFWLVLGDANAARVKAPLTFLIFCVPVGEQLIPWLQQVAADVSVAMLQGVGIPLYRSGLFIEIPNGQFLVAEACSGVSFLIGSVVFGCFYAYLSFRRTGMQLAFVGLSVVVPILANGVRVFGIISVGYYSDMEYAVGADHLIYGWFFFALVLLGLFLIGELLYRFERRHLSHTQTTSNQNSTANQSTAITVQASATSSSRVTQYIAPVALVWALALVVLSTRLDDQLQRPSSTAPPVFSSLTQASEVNHSVPWQPSVQRADWVQQAPWQAAPELWVLAAGFDQQWRELSSQQHRLFQPDVWTLVTSRSLVIADGGSAQLRQLADINGNTLWLVDGFVVNGTSHANGSDAMLAQIQQLVRGRSPAGFRLAVAWYQPSAQVTVERQQLAESVLGVADASAEQVLVSVLATMVTMATEQTLNDEQSTQVPTITTDAHQQVSP